MEAAIAWLVQTILATLLVDKLDAWIRQAGLADDIEKLKSEMRRIRLVVSAVKGRAIGNEPLVESLTLLKELLCDAEDVVDELDYYRLQQQMEGATVDDPEGVHATEQVHPLRGNSDIHIPSNRGGKKRRSKAWENFDVTEEDDSEKPVKARCKHCLTEVKCATMNGTSGMRNHTKVCKKKPAGPNGHSPNLSSTGDSISRKRRREDEEPTEITAADTHIHWDKAELSSRIQKITSQLQGSSGEVSEFLKLHGLDSGSASSSYHHHNTASHQYQRTSSLVPRRVYGRVAEKNSIIRLILEDKHDDVRILPIVGIAGVGKTTLAQLVYNDPDVQSQFDLRMWVWVSHNFDQVRLTREMLDFVPRETHEPSLHKNGSHEGIHSLAKLQEMLKSNTNSKRLLIVLDDVWDDMNDWQWDQVLTPLVSSHVEGSVILVTTRNLSVAQRLGTLEPVSLGALDHHDFWLLFKSRAFGDKNYEEHQSLSAIGQKIAEKLKGNPLAAESTGQLLREELNANHWNNILKNEDWKSMQLSRGIMPALKLSYDQLPYHSQQCFSYCSIFPDCYQFLGQELVCFWISQGFVKSNNSSQTLEEIGQGYLTDLINLGFFQQVKREESHLCSQIMYVVCGLMHDFAMTVSRTECATIGGLQCNKISPTIRHLSILTDSGYIKDEHGNIPRNEKFEENLKNAVTSVSKLRTLVLLGQYDSFFLQLFQDIFKRAHNLRLLHMSAASADLLKRGSDEVDGVFPQVLGKLYHLQVLDVGSYTDPNIPDGINNLVSLKHLVVWKGVYASIATIDNMALFQKLHGFKFQISSNFEITQSQSMSELVQGRVHQLDSVKTMKEVYEAVLQENKLLEKMHLSRKVSSAETGVVLLPMDESGPSSEPSVSTTREMLEEPELRRHLEILQISGYNDATTSNGHANICSVTSLVTLHLFGCGEWKTLPSLDRFLFLTKLKLSNLPKVIEVLVPSLEELVLVEMLKLERCSCTSVDGMSSSLRALQIEDCQALKEFDLFGNNDKFQSEPRLWLSGLRKLILSDCPQLEVLMPLPPSTTFSELLITRVSTLPSMKGSSSEKLRIGHIVEDGDDDFGESPDELRILDDTILAFPNLRNLKSMKLYGCDNLRSFSFESFSHLVSLTSLKIKKCEELFSSDLMPEHTLEVARAASYKAFPSLESLRIVSCGITGKWLSLMLQHAPNLEELELRCCEHITTVLLSTEEEESSRSNLISAREDSSSGNQYDTLIWLARDGPLHVALNLISPLKRITIDSCPRLTFNWGKEGVSGFTSLEKLIILNCPNLLSSLVHKDGTDEQANGRWLLPTSLEELEITGYSQETLQPCFPRDITSLKKLEVWYSPGLQSLQLHSCTALEELVIFGCELLTVTVLEGLQPLGSLGRLNVSDCPGLPPCFESFSTLEMLRIGTYQSVITTSFCKHLTSLKILQLAFVQKVRRLTDEQERAVVLLKSLQKLEFYYCFDLVDLPAGLHTLTSLKSLNIERCGSISRLPEAGLPHSLEELEIKSCSQELDDECRRLATSTLKVKIGCRYVN